MSRPGIAVASYDNAGEDNMRKPPRSPISSAAWIVVILAGYTDEMKAFIDSNPGLQSRFNRYIEFPDYSAQELASIFLQKANECQYTCDGDVQASIVDIMERAVAAKDKNFGNGRFVRNLFETAIQRQAVRLSTQSPLTAEMLAELTLHDLGFTYDD